MTETFPRGHRVTRVGGWGLAVGAILLLFLGVRYCRQGGGALAAREVRVGYAVEAPYAFVRADGTVTGEGPEIARMLAERTGVKRIIWRQTEFSSLIPELLRGQIDVIASGLFITPERAQQVAFSRPTFRTRQGLLVAAGNPLRLNAYEAVAGSTARVAVLADSVEEAFFRHQLGLAADKLVVVPDARTGMEALLSARVEALALSAPTLRWMLMQTGGGRVELAEPFVQPRTGTWALGGGLAFRSEDRELRDAWDRELARFVGSKEHEALARELGFSADELPPCRAQEEREQ